MPEPSRRRRAVVMPALVALAVAPLAAMSAPASAAPANCPWMDPRKTPDQRAMLLLRASTLNQELRWLDEQSANNPTQTDFPSVVAGTNTAAVVTYPVQVACTPHVVYSDGPDYVRGASGQTIFPAQIALASTWNERLTYAKGAAQADEAFRSGRKIGRAHV